MIEPFAIHAVDLPGGGAIGIARMPGRSGDLEGDVGIISAWGTKFVLSMTGDEERAVKGAGELPVLLAARGIFWRSFAVADFGVPEAGEPEWQALSRDLHAILDKGGRILIHCAGGCGRSGMAALRLLVERGGNAQQSLEVIRQNRPCAVETEAQFRWAENAEPCG